MPWGSKMLLSELRERVRQGFLEFAWRQWAQMGVSANIAGFDRWAIDPEALILFTIGVAQRDPRLFDEMLDWLAENRRLLTMQRLRNLSARLPVDTHLVGAVIAWAGEPRPLQWLQGLHGTGRTPDNVLFSAQMSWVLLVNQIPPLRSTATSARGLSAAVNRGSRT